MSWWQVLVFVGASGLLALVSWRSLRKPNSHGFYRFFAWEAMLVLLLLNAPHWSEDRHAPHQLFSAVLLCASLLVLFAGIYQMRRFGKAGARRLGEELFAFERTSQLVTSGIFRYIRHPMYCSLLLLAWGIAWKHLDLPALALALLASLLLWLTARRDEAECLAYFGDAYRDYMRRSRMFIPFLF